MSAREERRAPGSGSERSVSTDASFTGRTALRNLAAPVRDFLSTETGGAVALLAATIAALPWANAPAALLPVDLVDAAVDRHGSGSIAMDLRHWVNEGLMTFFFLVVGLEAKRELDMGELRERRRLAIPAAAARRDRGPNRDLPGLQRRRPGRARLGRGDVDRHRLRAGRPGAGRAARRHPAAGVPAHARRGRRPRGAGRDRHRLHRPRLDRPAGDRGGPVSSC